jgi:hypothetical protein
MNIDSVEIAAGTGQLLVVYINVDQGESPDPVFFTTEIAKDAALRQQDGWRLASLTAWPMRQMGTAGNVLFQSGGQYATQLALIATYLK